MNRNGELKTTGVIADNILGIRGLWEMGFIIPETNLKPRHVLDLLEKRVKLPSMFDITKADDIELQEITENITKSTENLISQMKHNQSQRDDLFEYPLRELLGLDKQLRSIRGSLKVEVAKRVQLEESIKKEKCKVEEIQDYLGVYDRGIRGNIMKWIAKLNDELKARQESIDFLKGRLTNQITSFKEKYWTKTPHWLKR